MGDTGAWRVDHAPFSATTPFGDDSQYSWTASGEGWLDHQPGGNTVGLNFKEQDESAFPKQTTLNVTVTDPTSGVTDTNTYAVNWHLPLEKREFLYTQYSKKPLGGPRLGPISPNDFGAAPATQPAELDVNAVIDGVLAVVTAGVSERVGGLLELVGKWADVVEYKAPIGPEGEIKGAYNNDAGGSAGGAWSEAQRENTEIWGGGNIVPASLANQADGWTKCDMWQYEMEHDKDKFYHAYGFNGHGYDGNDNHLVSVHVVDPNCVWDEKAFAAFLDDDDSGVRAEAPFGE